MFDDADKNSASNLMLISLDCNLCHWARRNKRNYEIFSKKFLITASFFVPFFFNWGTIGVVNVAGAIDVAGVVDVAV